MTVLVAVETVLLILLSVLVVGLLRSHAEILMRLPRATREALNPDGEPDGGMEIDPRLPAIPQRESGRAAPPLHGESLRGDRVSMNFAGADRWLLAFLTSGCVTCQNFWDVFRDPAFAPAQGVALVVLTKSTDVESPSRLLEREPGAAPLIMSTEVWHAYDVEMSPYFVLVDGPSEQVIGEGAATSWEQVQRLVNDAILDIKFVADRGAAGVDPRLSDSHPERIRQADAELLAAGVGPDHPTLRPGAAAVEGPPPPRP